VTILPCTTKKVFLFISLNLHTINILNIKWLECDNIVK